MRFRANLTSVTNPRIEVHALLSRFHPSWKGLVEGTCRHRAGLQHRCSACEKLELCITSDKYNLFYQTTWFLRINPCVFRRSLNLVPDKRFRRNQTYPQRRFVPRKRFRWYKFSSLPRNSDQPRNVWTAAVQNSPMVFPLTQVSPLPPHNYIHELQTNSQFPVVL